MIRIAVDAMGGDHAPAAVVRGAVAAVGDEIAIDLVGDGASIERELARLGGPHTRIRVEHADAFRQMNLDWINQYWKVEDADRLYLDHPQEKILDPGGAIFMALFEGETVGTVALIPMGGGTYELAKMAVDQNARG